jgi:hypothetical protein
MQHSFSFRICINATHLNISVRKSHREMAAIAARRGLNHRPRGKIGIYDVWLEEDFLIEFVEA